VQSVLLEKSQKTLKFSSSMTVQLTEQEKLLIILQKTIIMSLSFTTQKIWDSPEPSRRAIKNQRKTILFFFLLTVK